MLEQLQNCTLPFFCLSALLQRKATQISHYDKPPIPRKYTNTQSPLASPLPFPKTTKSAVPDLGVSVWQDVPDILAFPQSLSFFIECLADRLPNTIESPRSHTQTIHSSEVNSNRSVTVPEKPQGQSEILMNLGQGKSYRNLFLHIFIGMSEQLLVGLTK